MKIEALVNSNNLKAWDNMLVVGGLGAPMLEGV
jgi:hypothetical protein